MKQKITYIFALIAFVIALVAPAAAVTAHNEDATSNTSGNSSSESEKESTEAHDTREVNKEFRTRDGRIGEFKKRFKVNLSLSEIERIKLKCVGAQSVVGNLHSKFGSKAKPRTEAYANLQSRLDNLVVVLKAKNVDTTTLEQQITELKARIATFNNDLTVYKEAIADLKDVACKSDPTGFQAALLAARTAHDTLLKDIKSIRSYIVETLKPTLQTIKQQMEGKKEENEDDNSNNSTEGSN